MIETGIKGVPFGHRSCGGAFRETLGKGAVLSDQHQQELATMRQNGPRRGPALAFLMSSGITVCTRPGQGGTREMLR